MIIKKVTIQKYVSNNFIFITFLRIRNSGKDRPITAIIKASAVPIGTPFAISDWTTGITPAELVYIGIPMITAKGTAKGLFLVMYASKNQVGINPWITAQTATPSNTYGIIFHIKAKESLLICFRRTLNLTLTCCIVVSVVFLTFKIKSAT
jgi:hypothetical protein